MNDFLTQTDYKTILQSLKFVRRRTYAGEYLNTNALSLEEKIKKNLGPLNDR